MRWVSFLVAAFALGGSVSAQMQDGLATAGRLMAGARFKEAEAELRRYLVTDAMSARARYMLAYALLREDRGKDALEEYTRAARLQTPGAEDLRNVAQAYVLIGDYADADKWMAQSLAMNPKDADTLYSLGRLRYTEQKFGDAADCFERALVLVPKSVKLENNLGLAYEALNRSDDAVKAYRQAIAWQAEAPAQKGGEQPLLNLASALLRRRETAEAEPLLLEAVRLAPADPRIHEQLGQLYLQTGRYAEAEPHLAAAVKLDPGKSNLHFLLGQVYRHEGRPADAKAEFDAVTRLAKASAAAKPD